MNFSSITCTRRDVLKLVATSTTVTLLSGVTSGCGLWKNDIEQAAQRMIELINYPDRAREMAAIHVARSPELQQLSYKQWTRKLLDVLEIDPENITKGTLNSLHSRLREQIKQDFVNENVVIVNKWMLSDTELKLFSLATSYTES
ncbi:MAG: hypothetical protein BMS9Abin25_0247 [Gammaproteobacteria bacterium]|nr:MAG: hypothetical protein BMS9Abin25_0247 [Gammaproteobacteria bacterium]